MKIAPHIHAVAPRNRDFEQKSEETKVEMEKYLTADERCES
jgi:hypothetical protein